MNTINKAKLYNEYINSLNINKTSISVFSGFNSVGKSELCGEIKKQTNKTCIHIKEQKIISEKLQVKENIKGSYKHSENIISFYEQNRNICKLKIFQLLYNNFMKHNYYEIDLLIIEEPEAYLHPVNIVKVAELITILQKEYKIDIILTTLSPYFLNAIEVYTAKHKINNYYYLIYENNKVEDVSNEINKIYAQLARPFQDLENLSYKYDN